MNRWLFPTVAFLSLTLLFSTVQGDACGGLLEADGGDLEFPVEGFSIPAGQTCVWLIKLLSREQVNFKLNRLDIGSTLSLYPEHESTEIILNPIVLTNENVGETVTSEGQTLVVILTTDVDIPSMGFSFSWDSISTSTSDLLRAANYIDTEQGRVLWNRFNNHERLTWSLNLQPEKLVTIRTETVFEPCEALDPCTCSYFALYEVTETGRLREVTRVCGRSSSFQIDDLYPQLLAFVYINSTTSIPGADHVQLEWASGGDLTPTTTTTLKPTTNEPPTDETTPNHGGTTTTCGGVVFATGHTETYIEYKLDEDYADNEHCLWTIQTDIPHARINIILESQGFVGIDGLTVNQWNLEDNTLTELQLPNEDGQEFSFDSPTIFLSFTSDNVDFGPGFRVIIHPTESGPAYPDYRFSFYSLNEPLGNFRHPEEPGGVYQQNERASAVFQPSSFFMNIFLNFMGIEESADCKYDSLDIYRVRGRFGAQLIHKLCGTGGPADFNETTEFPILALFKSDTTAFDVGFGLVWSDVASSHF